MLPKKERRKYIYENMRPFFASDESAKEWVSSAIDRRKRNLVLRRSRLARKIHLNTFNYFCTFTYSDELHTAESFRKKLKNALSHFSSRNGWSYIGVWERAPESNRLHFHGIFNIPNGTMPGELIENNYYSIKSRRMNKAFENTYFNKRFGRSDFKVIDDSNNINNCIAYLCKYMEKTGERMIFSKHLPQYYIGDILEEDVVMRTGNEERKLILFDDFMLLNATSGEILGSAEAYNIKSLPHEL